MGTTGTASHAIKVLAYALLPAFLLLLILAPAAPADENSERVGTRAFAFLKRDVGARAAALGGAFTGYADDASTLFYNPGATVNLKGKRSIAGYQNFVAGINAGFIGYLHPLSEREKAAVFINYVDYGEFIRTDNTGTELGVFGGSSIVFGVNYSREFHSRLQAGGNFKLIYSNIGEFTASGAAIDLGVRYKIKDPPYGLRKRGYGAVGFAIQNLGGMISAYTATSDKDPLPITFRLGGVARLRGLPFSFAADLILPVDNEIRIGVGAEYEEIKFLALRAGWSSFGGNFRSDVDDSPLAGFSFGVGFRLEHMNIGYSISPMNDLGESHRITLTRRFDPPRGP